MSKLVTSDGLDRVAKSLNDKIKTETNRAVAKEELLSQSIQNVEDVSHEHNNLNDLNNYGKRTMTIGNASEEFYGAANVAFTLDEIGAAEAGHNHNTTYYTKSEIDADVKVIADELAKQKDKSIAGTLANGISQAFEALQDHQGRLNNHNARIENHNSRIGIIEGSTVGSIKYTVNEAVKAEADRAKAAEVALQANIDKKANSSHGNHVPETQTANNAKFLRNDNTWATVTPGNIGAAKSSHTHDDRYYTETEVEAKITTINTTISTAQSNAQKYADNKIAALVNSAPEALNTLNELATAITDHQDVYDAYVEEVSSALAGKSDTGHTHKYAGSSSAGGAATSANKVNQSITIKLNGGTTEGTNLFTFNGSAAKSLNITPDSIGAAASSHGTHVSLASATPKVASGSGDVGSSSKQAREDHVHPVQTDVTGNAGTATKLKTARTITLNGIVSGSTSFDGSGNVTITTAANDITAITKSLTVGTDWMNTGITGSHLSTGTYAVQMFANCQGAGGLWREYFSGIMSWVAEGTNSDEADEISLHKAGHAPNNQHIYLRTKRNNQGSLVLQIAAKAAIPEEIQFEFKFKKLI